MFAGGKGAARFDLFSIHHLDRGRGFEKLFWPAGGGHGNGIHGDAGRFQGNLQRFYFPGLKLDIGLFVFCVADVGDHQRVCARLDVANFKVAVFVGSRAGDLCSGPGRF